MVISDDSDKEIAPQLSRQATNLFILVQFYWLTSNISILELPNAILDS